MAEEGGGGVREPMLSGGGQSIRMTEPPATKLQLVSKTNVGLPFDGANSKRIFGIFSKAI